MKSFIWIGAITLVFIGIMVFAVRAPSVPYISFEAGKVSPLDNVKGNASSSVVFVEYSDFQCPACKTYYPVMRQMMTEFGDRVAFVYRNFPLTGIHINAEPAAWAAQAAAKQGKFWEMHDLLFEKQAEWENKADPLSIFESYSSLIGLNPEQFKADFGSKEIRDFVKAQMESGNQLKLLGTPSFFINGKQIQNPTSIEAFRAIFTEALQAKKQ